MSRKQIELIKDKLDIVDVIGKSVSLTNSGGGIYKGATSGRSKSGQSLNVDQNMQLFNDWANDGISGDVYNWIAYKNKLDIKSDFSEIIKIAADFAGVELEKKHFKVDLEAQNIYTFTTAVAEHYHNLLTDDMRKDIFNTWGITNETIDKLKIGFAPKDCQFTAFKDVFTEDDIIKSGLVIKTSTGFMPLFNNRIMFPYWKSGKVVYFIGKWTDSTPKNQYENKYKKQLIQKPDREYVSDIISNSYFYGEDSLKSADYCIITEGVTDCIMALQSGIPCISPVTTRFKNQDHEKILSLIGNIKNIVICNDNEDNKAGFKGAMDTAEYLFHNNKNVKLIELPKGKDSDKIDMAEYLRDNTKEDFEILIKNAKSLLTMKLSLCDVSEEPLDNIITATDFLKNELNGQPISYKVVFAEKHLKTHFSLSSIVIREIISELKSDLKERKKIDAERPDDIKTDNNAPIIPENIQEAARHIIYIGDPVKKIIDTHQSLHIGDTPLAKSLLLSVGVQSVKNSDGIHPKVSGDSGKGKTHCCKAMIHMIPKKHRFATTLSDKAIYYMDIPEGAVIFSDDVDLSDSLQGVIKRATSNYQDGDTYTTIDKNRDKQELTIPPRVTWWLTSVDDDQSLQLLNRQFGGGVDESANQDDAVLNFQKQLAISGQINLPENDDVQICRCIIQDMKDQIYTVLIPFAEDMKWVDKENRRNFPIFLDIIKAFAVLRHRQRYHTADGKVIANIEDFNDAKDLYIGRAKNQGTKLTDTELKFCNFLNGAGEVDYNHLQSKMGVSQGRISQIIHGKGKGDSGLVNKLKGLVVEKQSVKTDDDTTVQRTVCSLHGFKPLDNYETVITLKEGAEDTFKLYYPDITLTLPDKNALPCYYITNITYYNRICSNKVINSTVSDEKCVNDLLPEKSNNQGNKVINSQPIAKEQGNMGGNEGGILPHIPKTAQLQLVRHLQEFKKAQYRGTPIIDPNPHGMFIVGFLDAHQLLYKSQVARVTAAIEQMNRSGWR